MEKNSSIISYLIGLLMMWLSRHSVQDMAFMTGTLVALVTMVINVASFFINWYYRRKTYRLLKQQQMPDEVADEYIR